MNLFQKSFGKGRNMSSVINQDISIGSNLKSLRLQNKLSQEDVAIQLQIMGFTMLLLMKFLLICQVHLIRKIYYTGCQFPESKERKVPALYQDMPIFGLSHLPGRMFLSYANIGLAE